MCVGSEECLMTSFLLVICSFTCQPLGAKQTTSVGKQDGIKEETIPKRV